MMSAVRAVLFTIFGLSLYALSIPEVIGGLNTVLTAIFHAPFPPESVQKWHLTNGISRDFIDLRQGITCATRNTHSRSLFILFHMTAIISPVLVVVTYRFKSKK